MPYGFFERNELAGFEPAYASPCGPDRGFVFYYCGGRGLFGRFLGRDFQGCPNGPDKALFGRRFRFYLNLPHGCVRVFVCLCPNSLWFVQPEIEIYGPHDDDEI